MATERYRMGDLVVDAANATVRRHDTRLELPPLSFALLVALLRRAPDVARRQELIDEVWDGALVSDQTLSRRVLLLREALGDDVDAPRYLVSARGWGYRVVAPVERLDDSGDAAGTVAVLPFANLGGDARDEPLCEGLAESIIGSLTRMSELRVIARTSSFAAARMGLDAAQAGRRLGAGSVLEGSVQRVGRRVRVAVQLVDTDASRVRWSERYDRELRDVLDLEDDIAAAVAHRMRGGATSGPRSDQHRAVDPEAYEAYLEGRFLLARPSPPNLEQARLRLERAVSGDPTFAPAFDTLAELHWYLGFFGGVDPRHAFGQSTWYAVRALELDGSRAGTHALLAMLRKELDYSWDDVDREIAQARTLNPTSPEVRLRAAIAGLLPHGLMDEALAEVDEVLASDPLSPFVHWWAGAMASLGRHSPRTAAEGRTILELDESSFLGHWLVGVACDLEGDVEGAVASLRRADELAGSIPFTLGFLAWTLGRAGQHDDVREILGRLRNMTAVAYASPFASALAHVGLGDVDAAFASMRSAVEQRDPLIMPIKSYHYLDAIRDDPRFDTLLRDMHLA